MASEREWPLGNHLRACRKRISNEMTKENVYKLISAGLKSAISTTYKDDAWRRIGLIMAPIGDDTRRFPAHRRLQNEQSFLQKHRARHRAIMR